MHESTGPAASPVPPAKVAIVLASDLPPGAAANISACLAAGLAAAQPGWAGRPLTDAVGLASAASSHLPITILRGAPEAMRTLLRQLTDSAESAREAGAVVSLFPAYAQSIHDCATYWQQHGGRRHVDEAILGVGLHGPKRWVSRLTGSLPLFR